MAEIKFYQDAAKTRQVYPEINPDGIYPGVTVGLADNLTSDEGLIDEDTWQFRTTGGELDVSDGYASLHNLIGSTESSTIEESLTYNLIATGIQEVNISLATFKTQVSNSGTYNFIYTPDISYSSQLINTLNKNTFANATGITPGTYTFAYNASISTSDPDSIIGSFNQSTFVSKVNEEPGTYTFTYNGSAWYLGSTAVTLSQYGITTTGTIQEDDSFTINYNSNSWYLSSNMVSMSYYGITTTGTESVGDTLVITYTKNEWDVTVSGSTTTDITLSNYGITITNGTAEIADTIQVIYVAEQIGAIVTSYPQYMHSLGLNQFNKDGNQIFTGYRISATNLNIQASSSYDVIYFKVTPETYTIETQNAIIGSCAWTPNIPTTSTTFSAVLSPVSSSEWASSLTNNDHMKHFLIEDEGYLCVSIQYSNEHDTSDICCHLTWEAINDGVYESYYNYDMAIPYTDDNGTLIREYGLVNLDDTTEYYDEIDFVAGKWYERTTRIAYSAANLATVQALDVPYMYDDNYIYYGIDTITHNLPDMSSDYKMSNYGTEELVGINTMPCTATIFYQDNLKDKLRFSAEVIDNKITSINSSSTNDEYPSALCMWNVDQALRHILGLDVETFSTTKTYAVGDYVVHDLKLYRCKTAITSAGAWNSSKWDESYLFTTE